MHRIQARRTRARRANALALGLAFAATVAHAATEAATPSAVLPRPPHQVTPDAPLYPDYYALALTHTSIQDDASWRPLHLQAPPGHAIPAFIVLPVQTQAYGFSPTFRALLGARLDQELQRRHIDATRQTDIVDWRGPFVRRSDDATVAAFAAEHASSALLTLYLGHDADGHAFVTLGRTDAGKQRLAHRRIDIPQDEIPALGALTDALSPMLAELDLGGAKRAPALPSGGTTACDKTQWNLADLAVDATPVDTACHALLMGTLMPDFLSRVADLTQPSAPDRLAWLARAWVEADALAAKSPAMRSAATLASLQLRLDGTLEDASSLVDDGDAVVRPLARMLWAHKHVAATPQRSRDDAADHYVQDAVAGLPAFAAAVVVEHAGFTAGFRRVDLCPMQLALPYFRRPVECEDAPLDASRPKQPAYVGQRQLVEDWRVAAAWSALHVEGEYRGNADGLAEVLRTLPPRIATHPIVRTMRYAVSRHETPAVGAQPHLEQVRARVLDYVQAIATLQRDDALIRHHNLLAEPMLQLEYEDPALARVRDDLQRLAAVEILDFWAAVQWRPELATNTPATFMADGNFIAAATEVGRRRIAQSAAQAQPRPAPQASGPGATAAPPPAPAPAPWIDPAGALPPQAMLAQALADKPSDMRTRVTLALVLLEHGASVADARRLIDARPVRAHVEDTIGETHDWSLAGTMFYFAGELDAARFYDARAASYGTGSELDLMSRERVALIDGDLRGALERNHQSVERYGDNVAIADEASYLFMLHRPAEAWQLIVPRMQTSLNASLWRSALAGHRIAGDALETLPAWLREQQLDRSIELQRSLAPAWLGAHAFIDRLPTPADAAWLKSTVVVNSFPLEVKGALVMKAAIDGGARGFAGILEDQDMQTIYGDEHDLFLPFHAWARRIAGTGKDTQTEEVRKSALEAGFQRVLAKAMVLAADGDRDEALRFLAAARWELGRTGSEHAIHDEFRMAPYEFVLATWLMTRKTGEPAYAQQGLAIATAYQHVVESMGWPYAAEALLGRDPKAREIAACRAQFLDSASMFLHESGLHPDPKSAVCVKATAW